MAPGYHGALGCLRCRPGLARPALELSSVVIRGTTRVRGLSLGLVALHLGSGYGPRPRGVHRGNRHALAAAAWCPKLGDLARVCAADADRARDGGLVGPSDGAPVCPGHRPDCAALPAANA